MKLWQKLGFIGLAFTIPLALTTNFLVHAKSSKINVAQAELDGITYLRPLVSLQVNVVTHATAERRVLAGDASAVSEQQSSSSAVNAALDQLTQVDAKLSSKLKTDPSHLSEANLGTSAPATLRAQWQTTLTATTVEASDQNHEQLIAGVEGLITQIGNTSNLILDPDLDTYYTMDALLLQEPAIVDVLGQIGRTAAALGSSGLTLNDRKQLSADAAVLSGNIEHLTTDLETSFRTTKDYNHSTTLEPTISPLLQAASVQASSLNDALSQVVTQPGADPSLTANVSKAAVAAFNAYAALWPPLLAQEAVMLDARKSREISSRSASLLIVLAVLIVTAVLMVLVARRLVKDVDSLAKAARDLAEGDLTVRATVARKDEIGGLAVAFNQMAGRLEELSREVRDGAVGINTAASNILTSVSEQTAGAAQQSASLAQISVTTDELRTTAEVMLDRAEKMAQQARDTLAVSRDGNQAVDDIRHGMEAIGDNVRDVAADILALAEQTQQIGEITSLVSELADQSNLLALNANIEAAKAGEQGKGFAVVAAQVRLLAEQSKQATSQVATILTEIQSAANAAVIATEAGNKVVEDGMERATRAGDVIGRLGETILQTAESSQQIADGLEEQKIAIDQISQAIGDVSQATNQYVAGTESSQQTAQDLSELAGPLRVLTERYKVGVAGDGHSAGAS